MKKALAVLVATIAVAIFTTPALAQEQYIELLRSDIKTQKVAVVTDVMQFSEADAEIFWPIYREYDVELSALGDQMLAIIKDYAANYDAMTDEKANELMNQAFKLDEKEHSLRKKYFKKVKKSLGAITAAKFMQVERQIGLLIDVQIASEMPLVKAPGDE
jgi:hypothetical protein